MGYGVWGVRCEVDDPVPVLANYKLRSALVRLDPYKNYEEATH